MRLKEIKENPSIGKSEKDLDEYLKNRKKCFNRILPK